MTDPVDALLSRQRAYARAWRNHTRPLTEDERRELDDAAQIAMEHDAGYHVPPVAACLRCSPEMPGPGYDARTVPMDAYGEPDWPDPIAARFEAADRAMDESESGDPIIAAGILNAPLTAAEMGCTHDRADLCERAGEHVAPAPPPILTPAEMADADRQTLHAAAGIIRRRFGPGESADYIDRLARNIRPE